MSQRPLTVGVIGLGFGRAHIPGFQANGCQVVAVCQRDQAAARKLAERYGVPQVFERWQDLLERARPDIVTIATPVALHKEIALRAFAQGAHVLCEKPVAMERAEAEAMVEAATRARRVAMTGFNWRFPAAMQELHARVKRGEVGRVFHLSVRWLGGRFADESLVPTWRMDRALAGFGAMGDSGVHVVDLIRWNFGELTRLAAQAGIGHPSRTMVGGARPADTEDHCSVLGELAAGGQVSFTCSRVARGSNEVALEVYGTAGSLAYRMDREASGWWNAELRVAQKGSWEPVELTPFAPSPAAEEPPDIIGKTMVAPLVARMLEGIRKGETPSPSLEDGMRAQIVLDAVQESLARRAWVDVPH